MIALRFNFGYMNLVVYSFQRRLANVITHHCKGTRVHIAMAGRVYTPGTAWSVVPGLGVGHCYTFVACVSTVDHAATQLPRPPGQMCYSYLTDSIGVWVSSWRRGMWRTIGFCGISVCADQFTSRKRWLIPLSMAAVYTFMLCVARKRFFFFIPF